MMMARMQRHAARMQPAAAGSPAAILPSRRVAVSMAVNERNNSILVQARPDKMAVIAQVVEAVDIPVSRDDSLLVNLNRMQVYRLSGIDPEPVVKTLMEIGNLEPATRLEIDKKNSAIIAYASLADHVTIRAVVDKLTRQRAQVRSDSPPPAGGRLRGRHDRIHDGQRREEGEIAAQPLVRFLRFVAARWRGELQGVSRRRRRGAQPPAALGEPGGTGRGRGPAGQAG